MPITNVERSSAGSEVRDSHDGASQTYSLLLAPYALHPESIRRALKERALLEVGLMLSSFINEEGEHYANLFQEKH